MKQVSQFRWVVMLQLFSVVRGCTTDPQVMPVKYLVERQYLVMIHVRLTQQVLCLLISNATPVRQHPCSQFIAVQTTVAVGVIAVEVLTVDNQLLAVRLCCQYIKQRHTVTILSPSALTSEHCLELALTHYTTDAQ